MKINYKQIFILVFLIVVLLLPYFAFAADDPLSRLTGVATAGGYAENVSDTSMAEMMGTVIKAFFSLLGMIFLALMLFSGYHWMTASGDEAKVDKAKNSIRRAIIGLIITVGAWAIYNFMYNQLFLVNT